MDQSAAGGLNRPFSAHCLLYYAPRALSDRCLISMKPRRWRFGAARPEFGSRIKSLNYHLLTINF